MTDNLAAALVAIYRDSPPPLASQADAQLDTHGFVVIPQAKVGLEPTALSAQCTEVMALPTTKLLSQLSIAGVPARAPKGEEDASTWTTPQSRENAVCVALAVSSQFGVVTPLPGSFVKTGAKPFWLRSWSGANDSKHLTGFIVLSPEGAQFDVVPLKEDACKTIRSDWITKDKGVLWASDNPNATELSKRRAQFVANPRFTTALKSASENRTIRIHVKQGDLVLAHSGIIFFPVGEALLQSFRFVSGLDAWAWAIWDKIAREPIFDPSKAYPEGEFISYAFLSDTDPLPAAPKAGEPHFAPEAGWILDRLGSHIPEPLFSYEGASASVRQQAANPNSPGYKAAFSRLLTKMTNVLQNLSHYQTVYVDAFLGSAAPLYEQRIAGLHVPPELAEERAAVTTLWNRLKPKTPENIYKHEEGPKQVEDLVKAIRTLAPKMPIRASRVGAAAGATGTPKVDTKAVFVQRAREGLAEMRETLLETNNRQVAADLHWLEQELQKPVQEQQEWTPMRRVYDDLMKRFNPNYEGGALPEISEIMAAESTPTRAVAKKPRGGKRKAKRNDDDDEGDDDQIDVNGDPIKYGWDLVRKGVAHETDYANLRTCHCCGENRVLFINRACENCVLGAVEELLSRGLGVAKRLLQKKGLSKEAKEKLEAKLSETRKLNRVLKKLGEDAAFELEGPEGLFDKVAAVIRVFSELDEMLSVPPFNVNLMKVSTNLSPDEIEDSYDPMEESLDDEDEDVDDDDVDEDDDDEDEGDEEEAEEVQEDEPEGESIAIASPKVTKRHKPAPAPAPAPVASNLSDQVAAAILNFKWNVAKVREKLDDWEERWTKGDAEDLAAILAEIKRETPKWETYWVLRITWSKSKDTAICESVGPWNNHNKALLAKREYQTQNPDVEAELVEMKRAKH